MRLECFLLASCLIFSPSAGSAPLSFGTAFTYQGRLIDGTDPANGEYDFLFALFDSPAGTNQLGVLEFIEVDVQGGLVVQQLNFGSTAFDGQARWLEISIRRNDSGDPYTKLVGRQLITPAPYSLFSASVADGSITSNKLAVGSVGSSHLVPNSVTSAALNPDLALGGPGLSEGSLDLLDGTNVVLRLDAEDRRFSMYAPNNREATHIGGGELWLLTAQSNNAIGARLSGNAGAGGFLSLNNSNGQARAFLYNSNSGGGLNLYQASGSNGISLFANGSQISTFGLDGLENSRLWGPGWGELRLNDSTPSNRLAVLLSANGNGGGYLSLANSNGNVQAQIVGANSSAYLNLYPAEGSGGLGVGLFASDSSIRLHHTNSAIESIGLLGADASIKLSQPNGESGIVLSGSTRQISTFGSDGLEQTRLWGGSYGELLLHNGLAANATSVQLTTESGLNGALFLNDSAGANRALLRANGPGLSTGASLLLNNFSGSLNVDLRSQFSTGNTAAWLGLNDNGAERISFAARNGSTGAGGLIAVRNGSGDATVLISGDDGTGKGRVRTQVLEVTNGFIQVSGAGIGTSTPVFVHRTSPTNMFPLGSATPYGTIITHPLIDNDIRAILVVTLNAIGVNNNPHPYGVTFNPFTSKWVIINLDQGIMPTNTTQFNVMVVKP